jgi:lysophospholipase L1-like esterase
MYLQSFRRFCYAENRRRKAMFKINKLPATIDIGYTGEHQFREIQIDMTPWMELMPDGVPSIVHIRPGETKADAYKAETTFENNILTWKISMSDLGSEDGRGIAQVWLEDVFELTVNQRGKSAIFSTVVHNCAGEADAVPASQTDWETKLAQKVNKTDVVNNLEETETGKVLDARQGKALNDTKVNKTDIQNDLTATEEGKVLDAMQGKVLDDKKVDVNTGLEQGKFLQTDSEGKAVWGSPASTETIVSEVDAWLGSNITNPSSPPLDRSLLSSLSATPADLTGSLKNSLYDIINHDEISIVPVFIQDRNISSQGAFNSNNKRIATQDFIDISFARKTNSVPIGDNGYNEKLAYSIKNGYRIYVAYYSLPSESAFVSSEGWITADGEDVSGVLTPTGNYMRMTLATKGDTSRMTVDLAWNLTLTGVYTGKTIIDKIAHWGIVLKGYADRTSFNNCVDVGAYIIEQNYHISTENNPMVGSDGTLIVIPATSFASYSPATITGLIQIAMSNNGQKIYFRRVSGATTRTFGTWQKPLEGERTNIKTRVQESSGLVESNFEAGAINESGGSMTNSKRIRTKGYVGLGINNCIKYSIETGYRVYFVFFSNNSSSANIAGTGWLQGSGALYCPEGTKYYRAQIASVGDETSLTTEDYDALTMIYDYSLINSLPFISEKTRWLALGDSITYGVYSTGAGTEVKSANGWVNQLAGYLGYTLKNMGAPGVGFATARGDTHTNKTWADILDEVDLLEEDYNLITVAFGINDYNKSSITLEQIQASIDTGIQRLMTKFPTTRLVFITPFNSNRRGDASSNYCYNYQYGGRSLKDIADLIQSRCAYYGVECIYASNGFLLNNYNMSTLLPDNTHPSTKCHTLIAKNMAHYLMN